MKAITFNSGKALLDFGSPEFCHIAPYARGHSRKFIMRLAKLATVRKESSA